MKNVEEQPDLIKEAKQLDEKMLLKISTGKAPNFENAQELVMFDETFVIDPQRDAEEIKNMMRRVRKNPVFGRMSPEWTYNDDKANGSLKYSGTIWN